MGSNPPLSASLSMTTSSGMIRMCVHKGILDHRSESLNTFVCRPPVIELLACHRAKKSIARADQVHGRVMLDRPLPRLFHGHVWWNE
jgi:hypothetical protein